MTCVLRAQRKVVEGRKRRPTVYKSSVLEVVPPATAEGALTICRVPPPAPVLASLVEDSDAVGRGAASRPLLLPTRACGSG